MDRKPMFVSRKPAPDLLIFVVGSVVLDQMNLVLSGFTARGCHLFQEAQIRLSIEDRFTTVEECRFLQIDSTEDLDAFPGACHRNQRLEADTGPRLMERRVLPETGFVFKEDVGSFGTRFFLMLG